MVEIKKVEIDLSELYYAMKPKKPAFATLVSILENYKRDLDTALLVLVNISDAGVDIVKDFCDVAKRAFEEVHDDTAAIEKIALTLQQLLQVEIITVILYDGAETAIAFTT